MNKDYLYLDGKVIVRSDLGVSLPMDYYKNIEQVLIHENLIEEMENKIKILQQKKEKIKDDKYIPVVYFISLLLSFAFIFIIGNFMGINSVIISTIYGYMNLANLIAIVISSTFIPIGIGLSLFHYIQKKTKLKEKRGIESEINFLNRAIISEKEYIEQLKESSCYIEKKKGYKLVKINDKKVLDGLKNYLKFYYYCGYYEQKYYQYYQKGNLRKKLKYIYTRDGLELIEEYLLENQHSLSKKKVKNKILFK